MDRSGKLLGLGSHDASDRDALAEAIQRHLVVSLAREPHTATPRDYYVALVLSLREHLLTRLIRTKQRHFDLDDKRVYFLSMEFLPGRALSNTLVNLEMVECAAEALDQLGLDLDEIASLETEAGLGNGGCGLQAACLLDSLATLGVAAHGYGLRYEYGSFRQRIEDGWQREAPDDWLRMGHPWEVERPEDLYPIRFGGHVRSYRGAHGEPRYEWVTTSDLTAMAYDVPIAGYRNGDVNPLRLWAAQRSDEFDLDRFDQCDYVKAVEEKDRVENITRVLYPEVPSSAGKELRLKQEYFLVSASIQDIVARFKRSHGPLDDLPNKVAIQLNGTHPALAIAELMRIIMDDERLGWDEAWEICTATCSYTHHPAPSENLEEWSVECLQRVLPRHLQIIYEINRRFLADVQDRFPVDTLRLRRMSLINEDDDQRVRMSHLAIVGSHAVNGVSRQHSELMRTQRFPDFDEFYPWRFRSATHGVTPRRWLGVANPALAELLQRRLGEDVVADLSYVPRLSSLVEDTGFRDEWAEVKQNNKQRLADWLEHDLGIRVNPQSLFDCQLKPIHASRRQLLNLLHVLDLYTRLQTGQLVDPVPRTVLMAGKAEPSDDLAKLTIRLIHSVAEWINRDPRTRDSLQLIFLPDYRVSLAEIVIPAADLSQQISTVGAEDFGTGRLKFALNGALTIATFDDANRELAEALGNENLFQFGMCPEEAERFRQSAYAPEDVCEFDPRLRRAVKIIREGVFSGGDQARFEPLLDALLVDGDEHLVLADFSDYVACQERVSDSYRDPTSWIRKSILNVSRMDRFSSDHSVQTYARDVWGMNAEVSVARSGDER